MKLRKGVKQWNGRELEKVGIAEGKNGWHKCIPLFRISTSVSAAKLEKSKGYKRLYTLYTSSSRDTFLRPPFHTAFVSTLFLGCRPQLFLLNSLCDHFQKYGGMKYGFNED